MISFRTRDDALASSISIIAVLMLAGTFVWMLIPPQRIEPLVRSRARTLSKLDQEIDSTKKNNAELAAQIDPLLWAGNVQTVGPQALAAVSSVVKARNLRLVAFRPQRVIPSGAVTVAPFAVNLEGSFLNVMQFVKDLEANKNKIAVGQVQVSAADASSDNVNATVNIVAYINAGTVVTASAPVATNAPAPVAVVTSAGGKSAQRTK